MGVAVDGVVPSSADGVAEEAAGGAGCAWGCAGAGFIGIEIVGTVTGGGIWFDGSICASGFVTIRPPPMGVPSGRMATVRTRRGSPKALRAAFRPGAAGAATTFGPWPFEDGTASGVPGAATGGATATFGAGGDSVASGVCGTTPAPMPA